MLNSEYYKKEKVSENCEIEMMKNCKIRIIILNNNHPIQNN